MSCRVIQTRKQVAQREHGAESGLKSKNQRTKATIEYDSPARSYKMPVDPAYWPYRTQSLRQQRKAREVQTEECHTFLNQDASSDEEDRIASPPIDNRSLNSESGINRSFFCENKISLI
jgi:hypothetical protein